MTDRTKEFMETVKQAIHDKHPLTIQGGSSKSFMGRTVKPTNHILDTADHTGILVYEPVELILRARSGTPVRDIEQVLAEHGQCLSSEPGLFDGKATLGGTLAANLSGPARPFAGSIRDHVLGLSLINGKGQHLEFGGQVMKNVAGYDASRLQAGAMGTLGVMTDISLKVMPRWKFESTYSYECDGTEALKLCNQIASGEKPLSGACWYDGLLYLRFSTMESAIKKSIGEVAGTEMEKNKAEQIWSDIREFKHKFFTLKEGEQIWRISVGTSAPQPQIEFRDEAFDWGGALRWLKVDEGTFDLSEMNDWAARYNADCYLFSGSGKSGEVKLVNNEALRKIHINIKEAFDPEGIFNPGRLYGWM